MGKHYLVLDTETVGELNRPETLRTYDIGWIISDSKANTIKRRSFVVREVWENSALMDTAYYRDKLGIYRDGIANGTFEIQPFVIVRTIMLEDMVRYGITDVHAYNSDFDQKALASTINAFSRGYLTHYLPDGVRWLDVWGYAQDCICATPDYIKWAVDNRALTNSGNVSTTAESVYRYLTKNNGFIESHTAAEDAAIETAILHRAKRSFKRGSFDCSSRWRKLKSLREELGL